MKIIKWILYPVALISSTAILIVCLILLIMYAVVSIIHAIIETLMTILKITSDKIANIYKDKTPTTNYLKYAEGGEQ